MARKSAKGSFRARRQTGSEAAPGLTNKELEQAKKEFEAELDQYVKDYEEALLRELSPTPVRRNRSRTD
jgi:hypothetical protein